ncbi:polysaccharide deacetylase family protein [Streptacidiphilus monticola]|uniref:Polysaccharide deacetylase family protein n=1 Tax=Streptacidiphilus monticola TaxID=2161674 RepID=A0ABW1G7T8_9ACTN
MSPLDRRRLLLGGAGALLAGCSASPHRAAVAPVTDTPSTSAPATASRDTVAADLPFEIRSGPRTRPQLALTFHGQGDPRLADALLAEAERADARITVLAVGTWLQEYPALAKRILDGGHELGNHTQHHVAVSSLSPDRQYAEIRACADQLRKLTGGIGRWFRPSQAQDCTPSVAAEARRAGYTHCLSYDLDSLDWTDPGAEAVTRTVLGGARAGSVVSLHLGHAGTVAALPAVLDGLRQRGLRAVTTTELLS